jgi:phosphopantothenoylcysteine decarboxylase/phosphopantothenate--cysteine ligase
MKCIVTAGPTYEPLDEVRRLTNFSTGKLGSELANYLTERGHDVVLLLGESATWCGVQKATTVQRFTSTQDLHDKLATLASLEVNAVFHASAVSDFKFGKTWMRDEKGELVEMKSAKISTRDGTMLAELIPTPKIIFNLRHWFPRACLVGWKYEMDGDQNSVLQKGIQQITGNGINGCVVNGRAWGQGFGVMCQQPSSTAITSISLLTPEALYTQLEKFARGFKASK